MNEHSLLEFENAVSCSFDPALIAGSDQRNRNVQVQATEYLDRVKSDPKAVEYILQLLNHTKKQQVEFWCFQTFGSFLLTHQAIANGDQSVKKLTEDFRFSLRTGVLTWVEQAVRETTNVTSAISSNASTSSYLAKPYYIRQKVAVVVALLVKFDILDQWPTACDDLVQLLNRGPGAIALFLSVLTNIDQEVVAPIISRGKGDLDHSTRVKDRMRIAGIPRIIEACYQIMLAYRDIDPVLVREALSVCAAYISWIDMALIYNEHFIPLLFHFLQDKRYRCPAIDCLEGLLHKGVTPVTRKLDIIREMKVVDALIEVTRTAVENENGPANGQGQSGTMSGNDDDDDTDLVSFMESVSNLTNLIGMELLLCVDPSTGKIVLGVSETLCSLWQLVILCFGFKDIDVQQGVREVINAIMNLSKSTATAKAGGEEPNPLPWLMDALPHLLELTMGNMAYPTYFKFRTDDEDDAMFEEHRHGLKALYINMVRVAATETVVPCLKTVISTIFGPNATMPLTSRPFNQVEVVLNCVYAFAEGAPLILAHTKAKNFKTTPNVQLGNDESREQFTHLVAMVLQGTKSEQYRHHAVALVHNETFARYVGTIARFSPEIVCEELGNMAGTGGVHHANARVRSRSCYLLLKTCKALGGSVSDYANIVLQAIQDTLVFPPSVCFEAEDSSSILKSKNNESKYRIDDISNMFELAGYLISGQWINSQQKVEYMKHVMAPLHQKIEDSLTVLSSSNGTTREFDGITVGPVEFAELTARWIGSCVAGLAALTKGTRTKGEAGVVELFKVSLGIVLRTARMLSKHKFLKKQVMFFLHRMVNFMDEDLLEFVPEALHTLLTTASDANDLEVLVEWTIQLNSKFMRLMHGAMEEMFLPLLQGISKFTSLMSDDWGGTDRESTALTHDELERTKLIRSYTLLLMNLASSHMADVIFAARNVDQFSALLSSLASSMSLCPAVNTQKACCDIISALVEKWIPALCPPSQKSVAASSSATNPRLTEGECSPNETVLSVFRRFVAEAATPLSVKAVQQPWVKPKNDAKSSQLVSRVCKLHLLLFRRFGEEWLRLLRSNVLPGAGYAQQASDQYAEALRSEGVTVAQLKNVYKSVFLTMKQQ